MNYSEVEGSIFNAPSDYSFVQCISADFAMGKGIAVQFNKFLNTRQDTIAMYPSYLEQWIKNGKQGTCIKCNRVYNLVTKERYWNKPTYCSIRKSLDELQRLVIKDNVKKLAMPMIGCGLDGLSWPYVSTQIQNVFKDTDVDIVIYYL